MNVAAIYQDATNPRAEEQKQEALIKKSEQSVQEHIDKVAREEWLQRPQTASFLMELKNAIINLQLANENLATVSFETNKEEILKNTTRITELRKVINYAVSGKYEV